MNLKISQLKVGIIEMAYHLIFIKIFADWPQEDSEVPGEQDTHLWEESWDDDDTTEDFSKQLKYVFSDAIVLTCLDV